MKITYYGHSCFSLLVSGKNILFDPFIRGNELARDIDINNIEADYILVSHGHDDHTADLVYLASRTNAKIVCNWEIMLWLHTQGIKNVHPMNVGGKVAFDFGIVKMTIASHSSSMADGTYAGIAAGFLVQTENKLLYYSGDTGLNQDMKLIGEMYKPDIALLPIGDNFTMDAGDAAIAAGFVNCKHVIGLHYDSFGYIQINKKEAEKKFENAGIKLTLLNIGEEIAI
ncbi:MAG: metal-dependent hydrolase [Bacteroidia bacterium]|nr:metal-dependent hydrolase [Bacteroidia bacterium]